MFNEDIHTIHSTVKIGYKHKGTNPKNYNGFRYIHSYESILRSIKSTNLKVR